MKIRLPYTELIKGEKNKMVFTFSKEIIRDCYYRMNYYRSEKLEIRYSVEENWL